MFTNKGIGEHNMSQLTSKILEEIEKEECKSAEEKKKCFIITPIGAEHDPIRRHIDGVIDEAIVKVFGENFDISVSHRVSTPGSITKQILESIYSADLIIANLTNTNPNVMYELAFRHAVGKPVITIAEKGTIIPFDLLVERTIFYVNDPKGMIDLREELEKANSAVDYSNKQSGPIHEAIKSYEFEKVVIDATADDESKQMIGMIFRRLDSIESRFTNELNSPIYETVPSSNVISKRFNIIQGMFDDITIENLPADNIMSINNMKDKLFEINEILKKDVRLPAKTRASINGDLERMRDYLQIIIDKQEGQIVNL